MARVLCSYDKAFVFACRKGSRTNDVRVTKYDGEELIARWPDYDPTTGVAPTYPPKVATGCGTEACDEATDHTAGPQCLVATRSCASCVCPELSDLH